MTPRPRHVPETRNGAQEEPATETVEIEVPELQYVVGQSVLQMAVNVLVTRPYGENVPNAPGVVVGDVINQLRNLRVIGSDGGLVE